MSVLLQEWCILVIRLSFSGNSVSAVRTFCHWGWSPYIWNNLCWELGLQSAHDWCTMVWWYVINCSGKYEQHIKATYLIFIYTFLSIFSSVFDITFHWISDDKTIQLQSHYHKFAGIIKLLEKFCSCRSSSKWLWNPTTFDKKRVFVKRILIWSTTNSKD